MKVLLLGPPLILGDDGAPRPVRGHQAWAVLARVLLADRPISRRTLAAELFCETVDPLGALRWCLAALRRALGAETMTGDPIEAHLAASTWVDVLSYDSADFDPEAAGALLEGVDPQASADHATWLMIERERHAGLLDARLRGDVLATMASGPQDRAITLAQLLIRRRPYDEGCHILLVRSLVMAGKRKAALAHVEATEALFLQDLGEKPSLALRSAARQSIASAPAGVSQTAVIESLIQSGVAALSAGARDAGLDCLRRAAADAARAKDGYLQARALQELGAALIHSVRGYDDEGTIHLREAVALATTCGATPILARALQELGYAEALAGRRPSAAAFLDQALAVCEGDDNRLAATHALMGFNLVDWGNHDLGLAHFEQSLEFARRAGNHRREVWSLGLGGWGQVQAGRPNVAETWLTLSLSRCAEMRWISFQPWPQAVLAEARLQQADRPDRVRQSLQEPFALSCQLDDPCWEAASARMIGLAHAAEGDPAAALSWLERARTACTRVTDPYAGLLVEILADLARLYGETGDQVAAARTGRDMLSFAARTHADGHLARALALVQAKATPA